jgi:hypothetical protein
VGGDHRIIRGGETVELNASESRDPDGGRLRFKWMFYPEVGTYRGQLPELKGTDEATASFVAPNVEEPQTLHVILMATDEGQPPLTRYQRVVVQVGPQK